jgi:hypothetical protein
VSELADRLVDAYRPYVLARCEERGWERSAELMSSLDDGETWLRETLEALLALPFDRQRRGPLEVFQEAMRFPTRALADAGVSQQTRDGMAVRALPGDLYDLAPASTRRLGEKVWMAHMAWGARKAHAMTRSVVMVASRNLLDSSRIDAAASSTGLTVAPWSDASLDGVSLVCVDLETDGSLKIVEQTVQAGVPVVAYGPHRLAELLKAARVAGADHVMARSAFFSRLDLAGWAG